MKVTNTAPPAGGATPEARDARLKAAARDFEALMIAELLRAARMDGSAGWLGEEDAAADSAFGLAQEHFARSLAGTLGIARIVTDSLAPGRPGPAAEQGPE